MYAILKTGGKQYKVSEGDVIYVEKLGVEDGATVSFDEVLVVGEGDSITVGAPYVSGAVVTGTVECFELLTVIVVPDCDRHRLLFRTAAAACQRQHDRSRRSGDQPLVCLHSFLFFP